MGGAGLIVCGTRLGASGSSNRGAGRDRRAGAVSVRGMRGEVEGGRGKWRGRRAACRHYTAIFPFEHRYAPVTIPACVTRGLANLS